MSATTQTRPGGLIKSGEKITILTEWRDAGDENFDWLAIEDETTNGYLRVKPIHRESGEPGVGNMSVRSFMVQRA